jgi:hypothetical protein
MVQKLRLRERLLACIDDGIHAPQIRVFISLQYLDRNIVDKDDHGGSCLLLYLIRKRANKYQGGKQFPEKKPGPERNFRDAIARMCTWNFPEYDFSDNFRDYANYQNSGRNGV